MKKILVLSITIIALYACGGVQEKTKNAINKSGEFIGETSSEFIEGISSGVEKKITRKFEFKNTSKFSGIETGKHQILQGEMGNNNVLSLYLIYNKNIADSAIVKIYDKDNLEYARTKIYISGKKDEAAYKEIVFDERISIELMSRFTFE